MRSLLLTALLTVLLLITFACESPNDGGSASTPTDGYKRLYAAVKSKDTEKIKAAMSKKSQDFAQMVAARQNNPVEKIYENGFTATTFSETLPEIRDERVNGDSGAVEVWNAKESHWEDLGFVKEDGSWKLAIGEMFAGTFKSPGMGRDQKEKIAANAVSNNMVPLPMNANMNSNVTVITPKERQETNAKK
ncbi:MAG TPA: hypothetical protein VJV05_07775 [Pyrinomonadaceae bacterium]|nr:hypothetical protein [Pyrinomonadaceae bacterium]